MSKYETYKPSGIDWLGDVPMEWEVKKLKHILLGVNSGDGISNNEMEEDGEFEIYGGNGVMGYTNKYNSEGKVVVIGRVGAKCGVTYLLDKKLWISDNALQTRTSQNYKYLYYLLIAIDFNQYANQNAQPLITGTIVKNFPIPFIKNKDEQLNIANYLDHQTQKIDRLIANKNAQAEKLKELRQIEINNAVTKGLNPDAELKDSGIDWLGKIPKHWGVKRLKNILVEKMMYGANEIADEDDEHNPRYIRITDFGSNGELRDDTFKSLTYEVAKGYLLQEGDILFARSGATVGKTFQFRNYKGIACFAGYLIKARPNFNIITSDFLFFFTQSNGYENWKNSIFSKATIENIGADKYQLLKLCVPPTINEQNKITDFLQERTTAIDKLIKNIDAQIEKLQELRKIKIYEAVTGKIKVK